MRSSRERKTLINQPMRCWSHEIIVQILSEIRQQAVCNSFIFRVALGFDEGQGQGFRMW